MLVILAAGGCELDGDKEQVCQSPIVLYRDVDAGGNSRHRGPKKSIGQRNTQVALQFTDNVEVPRWARRSL